MKEFCRKRFAPKKNVIRVLSEKNAAQLEILEEWLEQEKKKETKEQ